MNSALLLPVCWKRVVDELPPDGAVCFLSDGDVVWMGLPELRRSLSEYPVEWFIYGVTEDYEWRWVCPEPEWWAVCRVEPPKVGA
jgi:hypothetical protein